MTLVARQLRLRGVVQGCGLRPALSRLARRLGLAGWAENAGDHVRVHIQGVLQAVERFVADLRSALPSEARLDSCEVYQANAEPALGEFIIRADTAPAAFTSLPDLPADRAMCERCRQELFDPQSRRYRWPFIACAACGPRYAWLKSLPFVRENTTFSAFTACERCEGEYLDAQNRRYGMELIACECCGPRVFYVDATGECGGNDVFAAAARRLLAGGVVALQGYTGFQLLAVASDANAVARLRDFKARRSRPLALLADTVSSVQAVVHANDSERAWLSSPHRPIVLLKRRHPNLWPWVAPCQPRWGIMLAAHGLHALVFDALKAMAPEGDMPHLLVATSANRKGEPLAGDTAEVLPWLGHGVDAIVHHSIPVWQVQDDSVLAVLKDGLLMFRRARGFAHEILTLPPPAGTTNVNESAESDNVMGTGAFLKTTVALRRGARVQVSQYVGDLESVAVIERKRQITERLWALSGFKPARQGIDAHPDCPVTSVTGDAEAVAVPVYHHRAHVAALDAEAGPLAPALVAAWDGIGYGEDGRWWGSEVFAISADAMRPVLGLQAFALPGGDRCAREPWRVMVALLVTAGVDGDELSEWLQASWQEMPLPEERPSMEVQRLVIEGVVRGHAFPQSTSMGRLLEAIAALLLKSFRNDHEGHVASLLEAAAWGAEVAEDTTLRLPIVPDAHGMPRWQWQTLLAELWQRMRAGECPRALAKVVLDSFANALVDACVAHGVRTLGVSGGCFQNLYWVETLQERCERAGLSLVRPRRFPPNDGAIALGQVNLMGRGEVCV